VLFGPFVNGAATEANSRTWDPLSLLHPEFDWGISRHSIRYRALCGQFEASILIFDFVTWQAEVTLSTGEGMPTAGYPCAYFN
jgi:hypothetical protein